MGMDEIKQSEHIVLSLCQNPKLTVKKFQISPYAEESVEGYRERVRAEMGKVLNKPLRNASFREMMELEKMVEKQLKGE